MRAEFSEKGTTKVVAAKAADAQKAAVGIETSLDAHAIETAFEAVINTLATTGDEAQTSCTLIAHAETGRLTRLYVDLTVLPAVPVKPDEVAPAPAPVPSAEEEDEGHQ